MGSPGNPGVRSIHDEPPLSERNTRPPPTVLCVAHMREVLVGLTYRSLTVALARGVVSAVSAVQLAPFHPVRKIRPSPVPTNTVLPLGMYRALAVAPLGNARRIQVVPLLREM